MREALRGVLRSGIVASSLVGAASSSGPAVAGAPPAALVGDDAANPTPVWVGEGAEVLVLDTEACTATPSADVRLPEGLFGRAVRVRIAGCDREVVALQVPKVEWTWEGVTIAVSGKGLLAEPPRAPWKDAEPKGEVFLTAWSEGRWVPAFESAAPDAGAWRFFVRGERGSLLADLPGGSVSLIDAETGRTHLSRVGGYAVVRLPDGRTIFVDPGFLADDDPLVSQGLAQARRLVDRFQAHRPAHEERGALTPVPAAGDLEPDTWRGRPVFLFVDPRWLRDQRFGDAYLDPTGHVLDHACSEGDRKKSWFPCGVYYLDCTAFGAWWPREETLVVALPDGTETVDAAAIPRLRLVVVDPFGDDIRVSSEW